MESSRILSSSYGTFVGGATLQAGQLSLSSPLGTQLGALRRRPARFIFTTVNRAVNHRVLTGIFILGLVMVALWFASVKLTDTLSAVPLPFRNLGWHAGQAFRSHSKRLVHIKEGV